MDDLRCELMDEFRALQVVYRKRGAGIVSLKSDGDRLREQLKLLEAVAQWATEYIASRKPAEEGSHD